jgi:hypothetical protein
VRWSECCVQSPTFCCASCFVRASAAALNDISSFLALALNVYTEYWCLEGHGTMYPYLLGNFGMIRRQCRPRHLVDRYNKDFGIPEISSVRFYPSRYCTGQPVRCHNDLTRVEFESSLLGYRVSSGSGSGFGA